METWIETSLAKLGEQCVETFKGGEQRVCKNWNGGQGEIYPFIPEIEEFAISSYLLLLLSFLFSRASTLPPSSPIRSLHDAEGSTFFYYQNSTEYFPSFLFFFEFPDGNSEESVDANWQK